MAITIHNWGDQTLLFRYPSLIPPKKSNTKKRGKATSAPSTKPPTKAEKTEKKRKSKGKKDKVQDEEDDTPVKVRPTPALIDSKMSLEHARLVLRSTRFM
ncbi:hypothetical protein FRB96_007430 [Tulasnella sp. 330]|nr:hypothetical protein FRB96_007430 [Tulasnella sp. 330]KAG8872764.1 hypothetical protein FRB97_007360 [Tulasnella sp. 331]KAG8876659.1 hypothetical protein FRB98_007093 [Tulasnella sp. 332]